MSYFQRQKFLIMMTISTFSTIIFLNFILHTEKDNLSGLYLSDANNSYGSCLTYFDNFVRWCTPTLASTILIDGLFFNFSFETSFSIFQIYITVPPCIPFGYPNFETLFDWLRSCILLVIARH